MTGNDLRLWLSRRRWNFTDASIELGLHRQTIARLVEREEIPRYVALAISAVEYDLPPWPQRPALQIVPTSEARQ